MSKSLRVTFKNSSLRPLYRRVNRLGADPYSTCGGREGVLTSELRQAISEVGYLTGNNRLTGI
jgi:hypothetical protein